ncbi:MAG: PilN domain-containing protein, partial [candidate division Zixibacteria bacterium]|nr:PilN domain-containing protein [candidate division Zixibacteria bacterium]
MAETVKRKNILDPSKMALIPKLAERLHFRRRYGFGRTIAILMDEQSLQLATAQRLWHKTRLLDVTKVYIPSTNDSPEKKQNFITAEIDRYTQEHRHWITRYILGVGGSESAVRILSFPKMSKQELGKAIFWEGNKQIPFGLTEAYYGHHIIDNPDLRDSRNLFASLIAVSKKEVNRRLDQLKTNIKIESVNHELEAIGHFLPFIDDFSAEKTYTLLNIKKNLSEISFYRQARLEFRHTSSVGSSVLTVTGSEHRTYEEFTELLVLEIQNSLDYYVGQFSKTNIETVFIYGDFSYSDELINNLTDRFGIEFKCFPIDRWLTSQPQTKEFVEQIPVSLGAIALAMDNDQMIDFLPPDLKEIRGALRFYKMAIPMLIPFAAALLTIWLAMRYQVNMETFRLQAAENQIEELKKSPPYIMYNRIQQQMAADKNLLDRLNRQATFLYLNLKELSLITPEAIKLNNYDLRKSGDDYILTLLGRTSISFLLPEISLADYVARLEGSPFFRDVTLKKYSKNSQGGEFFLDFQIEMST